MGKECLFTIHFSIKTKKRLEIFLTCAYLLVGGGDIDKSKLF